MAWLTLAIAWDLSRLSACFGCTVLTARAHAPGFCSRPIWQMLCVYCASHQACIKVLQPSQLQAWLGA